MSAPSEVVIGRAIGYFLAIFLVSVALTAMVYGLLRLVGIRLNRRQQIIAFCIWFGACLCAIIPQHIHH
jgi:hypothetical protein